MNVEYPRELQQQVERALIDGDLTIGRLYTLEDLAARYHAADESMRLVVRAARRKGLVEPVGAGSDAFRVLGLPVTEFASVFTHTAKAGFRPTSLVRKVVVEPAGPRVAERVRVEVGSPVYRYVRTRYVEGQPLANQINYMPFDVCPGLEKDDVTRYSFQKLLEEKYFAVLVDMQENYLLVPAIDQDREVLGLPAGASVLVVDRIALSATGWPLVWADIRIRPDRFEYVAALWPQAAQLLKNRATGNMETT